MPHQLHKQENARQWLSSPVSLNVAVAHPCRPVPLLLSGSILRKSPQQESPARIKRARLESQRANAHQLTVPSCRRRERDDKPTQQTDRHEHEVVLDHLRYSTARAGNRTFLSGRLERSFACFSFFARFLSRSSMSRRAQVGPPERQGRLRALGQAPATAECTGVKPAG